MELIVIDTVYANELQERDIIRVNDVIGEIAEPEDYGSTIIVKLLHDSDETCDFDPFEPVDILGY
jgi:hypothetical protein